MLSNIIYNNIFSFLFGINFIKFFCINNSLFISNLQKTFYFCLYKMISYILSIYLKFFVYFNIYQINILYLKIIIMKLTEYISQNLNLTFFEF